MKGFPKHINTKRDIENLLAAGKYKTELNTVLKHYRDNRFIWETTKELAAEKDGLTNKTSRVLVDEETEKIYQQQLVQDPNSKLDQLGITVDEIDNLINDNVVGLAR